MDGNNRWSKKNNKSLFESYNKGATKLLEITEYLLLKRDIENISAFALSTNNLKRSKRKLGIINKVIINSIEKILENNSLNFNIKFIGDLKVFDIDINNKLKLIENMNKNSKKTLNIFINYGGQEEIVNLINYFKKSKSSVSTKTIQNKFYKNLYNSPDLLIRTGGFQRLSNFLLYQISFSELFFLKKLWPDIKKNDLNKIIDKYNRIERKFGI